MLHQGVFMGWYCVDTYCELIRVKLEHVGVAEVVTCGFFLPGTQVGGTLALDGRG